MRISEIYELLMEVIPAHQPILITGAPGLGKTDIITKATKDCGADLIVSHPVLSDPTDAKGLPWVSEDKQSATFLPFGDLRAILSAKKPTVWFIDDIGQAMPAVQASYMQPMLARRVNGTPIPDCVTFVAASNRRQDRSGVTGLLEAVKSRFDNIQELTAHIDDWCPWALDNNIPVEEIAFLRFRPELLHQFNPTQDLVNQPSPRTWAKAAKFLTRKHSPSMELAILTGAVGEGAAAEFVGFLRIYRELPSLDGILLDPSKAVIPTSPAALYAVASGLASKVTESNFPRVAIYAERLHKKGKSEFAVLMLRDCVRRQAKLLNSSTFIKIAAGDLGKLISGE